MAFTNPTGPGQQYIPPASLDQGSGASSQGSRNSGGGGRGDIYDSLVIRPLGANGSQPGENYRVPPGHRVEIWPQPTNAGNFFVAEGPTQVVGGPREAFTPTSTGRAYPTINNISQLWFRFANAADEAVVRIVR